MRVQEQLVEPGIGVGVPEVSGRAERPPDLIEQGTKRRDEAEQGHKEE
jgi:hypothetical protein